MCVWAVGQKVPITTTLNLRVFFLLTYYCSYLWDQETQDTNFNNVGPAVVHSTYSLSFCWAKWKPIILMNNCIWILSSSSLQKYLNTSLFLNMYLPNERGEMTLFHRWKTGTLDTDRKAIDLKYTLVNELSTYSINATACGTTI